MKNIERVPLYLLMAAMAGAIIYLVFRKDPTGGGNTQRVEVVLNYDSLVHEVSTSVIKTPVTVMPGVNNIPAPVITILNDTNTGRKLDLLAEIINRYYEIRTQETTTATDSIVITTIDTITENGITGRMLQYKLLFPVSSTTTIVNKPERVMLFAGASVEAGANGLYGISPELSLALKKGTLVSIGYNTYSLATGRDKYAFRVGVSQRIRVR